MGGARAFSIVIAIVFLGIIRGEVTPKSIGVETIGGVMTKMIPVSSYVPIKRSKDFTTIRDRQTNVTIKIFEGDERLTKDCRLIGKLDLSEIPPAPRGTPKIVVTTEIDGNGYLIVKAEDKASGKSEKIVVTNLGFRIIDDPDSEEYAQMLKWIDDEENLAIKLRRSLKNYFKLLLPNPAHHNQIAEIHHN